MKIRPGTAIPFIAIVLLALTQGALAVAETPVTSPVSLADSTPAPGAVSGRITTENASVGIPGATVTIVSAADLSQVLYATTSDANGFYQFPNVPSTYDPATGTYALAYRVHAVKAGLGEGYSNSFPVEPCSTAPANVVLVSAPGAVSGRVTTGNTSQGIAGAQISLLSSSDSSIVYAATTSDANGFYQFPMVASTYDPVTGSYASSYRLRAFVAGIGEGYSNSFPVESGSTAPANVVILPEPGAVSGRITTTNTSEGVPGAYVALVSAADASQVLASATSDANGFYQFPDVPSTYDPATGSCAFAYKVHAVKAGLGEGFSNSFPVEPRSTSPANVVLAPAPGMVSGWITTTNTSTGVANALVSLISWSDSSIVYATTVSDANGFYQFPNVPSTYDPATGTYAFTYRIHASAAGIGEAYSNRFAVEPYSTAPANVVIVPEPRSLDLTASRTTITANGRDSIKLDAYVTDAYGPVADGTAVVFTLGNTGRGMGLLSLIGQNAVKATTVTAYTTNGHAGVKFGWATHHKQSNTITASWDGNSTVSDSVAIRLK